MRLPDRFTKLLRQKEVHLTLFGICFVLLNWPIIDAYCAGDVLTALAHIFIVWGIVIVFLFFVSMNCTDSPPDDLNRHRKGD